MGRVQASGYSGLFALTGRRYIAVAFLARLPLAMAQLGTLLLVATTTGSYTHAGICAGALAVANAIGAPWLGGLTDRHGQQRIVALQCIIGAIGLGAVVISRRADLAWQVTAVAAAATGIAIPQIGQLARVRWRPLIARADGPDSLVGTAFSYEGAADEASFVCGPALVGLTMAVAGVWSPLLVAAVMLAGFGLAFARHPSADVAPVAIGAGPRVSVWTSPFAMLVGAQFLMGNLFGSVQTGTTVLARAAGHTDAAGLFHALLGVGSVLAGLALGKLGGEPDHPMRLSAFATALLLLGLPLAAVTTLPMLAAELLVLGCAIAPYMITTFTLAELITPPSRTALAMTLLAGATGLGYATGAGVAGHLVDDSGPHPAFVFTVSVTAAACVLAWAARPVLRRAAYVRG